MLFITVWFTIIGGSKLDVASAVGVTSERLVAMGTDVSPREVSKKLSGSTWTTPVGLPGITKDHPRIYPITRNLWFVTNSNNSQSAWQWGVGKRTKDGGNIWSDTPDPGIGNNGGIVHVASDAGGRLWSLAQAFPNGQNYPQTKVFYSDNGGDSWIHSKTLPESGSAAVAGWKIVPHPTNANTIAVIGFTSAPPFTGFILSTTNRGGLMVTQIQRGNTSWPSRNPLLRCGHATQ